MTDKRIPKKVPFRKCHKFYSKYTEEFKHLVKEIDYSFRYKCKPLMGKMPQKTNIQQSPVSAVCSSIECRAVMGNKPEKWMKIVTEIDENYKRIKSNMPKMPPWVQIYSPTLRT